MQLSKKTKPPLLELVRRSDYRHTDVIRHYGDTSMVNAIESKSPSLNRLSKQFKRDEVISIISSIFIATAMYFDGELHPNKASIIAEEMLVDYHYSNLKVEDLIVITRELKEQAVYSKLSPSKILKQIADYTDRRSNTAAKLSINKTLDEKQENNLDERMKKSVRQIEDVSKSVVNNRAYLEKYYK